MMKAHKLDAKGSYNIYESFGKICYAIYYEADGQDYHDMDQQDHILWAIGYCWML